MLGSVPINHKGHKGARRKPSRDSHFCVTSCPWWLMNLGHYHDAQLTIECNQLYDDSGKRSASATDHLAGGRGGAVLCGTEERRRGSGGRAVRENPRTA